MFGVNLHLGSPGLDGGQLLGPLLLEVGLVLVGAQSDRPEQNIQVIEIMK
jgi:hypothetical protein